MTDHVGSAERFLELHTTETPLLLPNPWDLGSAKLLASLGFKALATTSGGFAASLGRLDGNVSREEAVAHAGAIAAATGLPVNGDFENCFADDPADAADTVRLALEAGIAGCSIEDWSGSEIYDVGFAAERVAAAAEAAHAGPVELVLTARAENHLRGRRDLADTIARLRAYQDAGADVLYAPGLRGMEEIRAVLDSIDRPLNVLAMPRVPAVAELAEAGVSRVGRQPLRVRRLRRARRRGDGAARRRHLPLPRARGARLGGRAPSVRRGHRHNVIPQPHKRRACSG